MGTRSIVVGLAVASLLVGTTTVALGRDRPYGTAGLSYYEKSGPVSPMLGGSGQTSTGAPFSKAQIEEFTCDVTAGGATGTPDTAMDISCNDTTYGQDWNPDNEIAIAVDPEDPDHLLAGSNDYFYRFNNANGSRQALVPTGYFTSFDGGESWIDGQVPMRSGNGAGDPAPAFDGRHDVALMAQLENTGGLGAGNIARPDVSVSRSTDGGVTWSEPVTVFKGQGNGANATNAKFWDKEWLTVDNDPNSDYYGRAYLTATLFQNGRQGAYISSPIYFSWSGDGGLTWSEPKVISGSNADYCTYQETGPEAECDEDQFSIPTVAPDGTLHVHFLNGQHEAAWEVPIDFDNQIMVVTSDNGGESFSDPVHVADLEDGYSDMPFSVIGRQTVWGHQLRWDAAGTIAVDPNDPTHVTVVWADRGDPNPNASMTADGLPCFLDPVFGEAPDYDPCDAGPGSDTNVYRADSIDGGKTWGARTLVSAGGGAHQWFPWAGYTPGGTLVAAWDQDDAPAPTDTFHHVYWDGAATEALGAAEHIDVGATLWAGQYVPPDAWPTVCGPSDAGTSGSLAEAAGKDCTIFHGDYTGLAVDSDGRAHIVWTGLNRAVTTPQVDYVTGELHDGYAQDAMYARR